MCVRGGARAPIIRLRTRRCVIVLVHRPRANGSFAHHVTLPGLGVFVWVCVRLDLSGSEVERGLAVPDTVWVKVTIKVVLAALATEAEEEEETEDGEGCDAAHCASGDSPGI